MTGSARIWARAESCATFNILSPFVQGQLTASLVRVLLSGCWRLLGRHPAHRSSSLEGAAHCAARAQLERRSCQPAGRQLKWRPSTGRRAHLVPLGWAPRNLFRAHLDLRCLLGAVRFIINSVGLPRCSKFNCKGRPTRPAGPCHRSHCLLAPSSRSRAHRSHLQRAQVRINTCSPTRAASATSLTRTTSGRQARLN